MQDLELPVMVYQHSKSSPTFKVSKYAFICKDQSDQSIPADKCAVEQTNMWSGCHSSLQNVVVGDIKNME